MTNEEVESSKMNNTLTLKGVDKFTHYQICYYLLAFPIVLIVIKIYIYFTSNTLTYNAAEVFGSVAFTLVAYLFYQLQKKRLRFKAVETNLSQELLIDTITTACKQIKCNLIEVNDNYIIAKTNPGFLSGSWGEQITIVIDKHRVLVNSICDPDKTSSVTSMGRNRKNVETIIKTIQTA